MKKRDFDYKFIYQNAQNIMIRNDKKWINYIKIIILFLSSKRISKEKLIEIKEIEYLEITLILFRQIIFINQSLQTKPANQRINTDSAFRVYMYFNISFSAITK